MIKLAIVRRRGKKWVVLTEDGGRVLGTHDTAKDAYVQLYAIHKSQERQKKKKKRKKHASWSERYLNAKGN